MYPPKNTVLNSVAAKPRAQKRICLRNNMFLLKVLKRHMIKRESSPKPHILRIKISSGFISPIFFYIMGKHCLQLKTTEKDFPT